MNRRFSLNRLARAPGMMALAMAALDVAGCAAGSTQLQTNRYSLTHPDFWKVKKQGTKDGEASVVTIPQYGDAVIDEGAGAVGSRQGNYESLTAEVEVRLYGWGDPGTSDDPTQQVARLLARDPELQLARHHVVSDNPPECGVYPKKYKVFGLDQTPLDLISRPGWRTIVVGGRSSGSLVGAVARVEFEQDVARFCHNLSNMRVQFQNLLDGLTAVTGAAGQTPAVPSPGAQPSPGPAATTKKRTLGGSFTSPALWRRQAKPAGAHATTENAATSTGGNS